MRQGRAVRSWDSTEDELAFYDARSDQGFKARPLALELFLAFDLLSLGHFLEPRIDMGPLGFLQLELCQPTFIVDGNRRPVFNGFADVVDGNVVAEDLACVRIDSFDRRAREADE